VELGTHTGLSYFSFCEAFSELHVAGTYFAVDHWKGDAHAGEYSDEIFDLVSAANRRYAGFSTLVRSSFDEALPHFRDASIDVLHIDGHHSYESVSRDFADWWPKVRPGGVALLHDTNVRRDDFGVDRLLHEVSVIHPTFSFAHGHGLGVVIKGDPSSWGLRNLIHADDAGRDSFAFVMSWAGGVLQDRFDALRLPLAQEELHQSRVIADANLEHFRRNEEAWQNERLGLQVDTEALRLFSGEQNEQITALTSAAERLAAEKNELAEAIDDIQGSISWQVTSPLRWLKSGFR
jgi:hypothetical protein